MIIHHGLLFCFLSALCGGNSGLVDAKSIIFTGPEGGNGTVNCFFTESGTWKFFCRDECKEKDILIKTNAFSADNGRYRIQYRKQKSGKYKLTVTITNLVQSDAGRYSCGLGGSSVPESREDFDVKVSDGLLDKSSGFFLTNAEGQDIESPCDESARKSRMFFCRGKCENQEDILIETDQDKAHNGRYGIEYKNGSLSRQYATIKKVVKSDSGEYTCGYGRASSPDSSFTFLILVDIPTTSAPTTTQSLISSSRGSTSSSVSPKTTNQPTTSASTPNNPTTTTQSLISSSEDATPSPVFTTSMRQTTPAVPTTFAPTTTQSLISSSRGSTSSSVSPKTTKQPTTSASTPNNPTTTTQSLISGLEDATPSPVFTKSTRQTTPAAPTTSAPTTTTTTTTTQRLSSTSSPVFSKTNQPQAAGLLRPTSVPSKVLPVAVGVPVFGGLLMSGFGLFTYLRKIKKCTKQKPGGDVF